MQRLIFLVALLSACGSDPDQEPKTDATPSAQAGGIERQPPDPKENVVEYRRDGDQIALALDDTKDLPVCERTNERQLAWIKGTEQFFACTDGEWLEIPVKGKSGDQGAQGPAGPKGEPGRPPSPNEWIDPITESRWLIGGAVTGGMLNEPCSNGWKLGTRVQLKTAIQHGLSLASVNLGGAKAIWSAEIADLGDGAFTRYFVQSTTQEGTNVYPEGTPGVACIAE